MLECEDFKICRLHEIVGKDILPTEYGGNAGSIEELKGET